MSRFKIYDVRVVPGDSAFLLDNGKTTILYDTGFGFTGKHIAENIEKILKNRKLDYILLTHSHYDHALASVSICEKYPQAKVVAGSYAAEIFKRPGAKALMTDLDGKAAEKYGMAKGTADADKLKVDIPVKDSDLIILGDTAFRVLNLPGHTRCSVGYYCEDLGLLLSCETLGVYNGKSSITPSVLVGCDCALSSIDRVSKLKIRNILAPHVGLLNEEQTRFFLDNMKSATENAIKLVAECIKKGLSNEDIYKVYAKAYRDDFTDEAYPEDAARLNTHIMTELIRKEYNL